MDMTTSLLGNVLNTVFSDKTIKKVVYLHTANPSKGDSQEWGKISICPGYIPNLENG